MKEEILKIVGKSIDNITFVYGEPKKITTYGNCIIVTFENNKRYKIGLMELFKNMAILD